MILYSPHNRNEDDEELTMAHAAQMTGFEIRNAKAEVSFFATLMTRFQQYRLYRQTVNELRSLSGRELADLGLSRSVIRATAYEAVYGA